MSCRGSWLSEPAQRGELARAQLRALTRFDSSWDVCELVLRDKPGTQEQRDATLCKTVEESSICPLPSSSVFSWMVLQWKPDSAFQ